jgi:hypothetical protein
MFEQIGGMRSWPTPESRRNRSGPRPVSGFDSQFSGSMPLPGSLRGGFPFDPATQGARIAALSQELGIPETTATWLLAQEAENPAALRQALGARSQGFARALEGLGTIPAAGDVAGAPLGEILMQAGEIREDPLNRALRALNRAQNAQGGTFVDEGGYERDLESGAIVDRATANPVERPINAAALSGAELAALMPASDAAEVMPYAVRALSASEKQQAFQESGASRTRAGQRNALAKEPNAGLTESARDLYPGTTTRRSLPGSWRDRTAGGADADDRYTWFTPGSVLGAGMEPSARAAVIPLVVAPASQERPGAAGRFQAPNVHLKSAGGFVPGLGDARILDVNPLAQLSPTAAAALEARLGESFYTRIEPDKSETGGYAGRATNAPIPDPATGAGGFDPIYDPATSRGGMMTADRPMTVAEAVSRIAARNLAPISPVMLEQLAPGRASAEIAVTPPVGEVFTRDAYPLGIPGAQEKDLSPYERLVLQAQRQGTDFVDARIGSRGRYGPGLYSDLDALVGVLAGEAFPDARARFQLQATASDLASRTPVTVQDPYRPLTIERPVGSDWSLLINSANKDDLISRYQQELITRAGLELPAGRNPLLALVDNLKGMAGAPVADVPMQAAAPAAQRAAREPAVLERARQQATMRANSSVRSQLVPSDGGSVMFAPDASAFERKSYEESARATLAGILSGRIELPPSQVAQAQPAGPAQRALFLRQLTRKTVNEDGSVTSTPVGSPAPFDGPPLIQPTRPPGSGLAQVRPAARAEISTNNARQSWIPGLQDPSIEMEDPYSRETAEKYLLRQSALRSTPATVLASRESQGWIPGLQVPYTPTLFTPDPADDVAREMARRAQVVEATRLADKYGGLRVVGPDPVYQPPLRPQIARGTDRGATAEAQLAPADAAARKASVMEILMQAARRRQQRN